MSDSYDNSPDFTQMLMQRIASKNAESKTPIGAFDPYKAMLNKKKSESGEPINASNIVKYPEKDVKALEDFCKTHGIVGFGSRMSPIAALSFLKAKMGIADGSIEDRVPGGYEKMDVKSKYVPNYPYESVVTKKSLLKG